MALLPYSVSDRKNRFWNSCCFASQTYQIFNAFGDALFSFMPFILAFSAAKRFKCNPYVSAVLAGVLLHSSFTGLNTGDPVHLFGVIPVTMISYGGSVVPILLIVWVQSYIEKFANKISPKPVKIFLAPMITIIVTGIICFPEVFLRTARGWSRFMHRRVCVSRVRMGLHCGGIRPVAV